MAIDQACGACEPELASHARMGDPQCPSDSKITGDRRGPIARWSGDRGQRREKLSCSCFGCSSAASVYSRFWENCYCQYCCSESAFDPQVVISYGPGSSLKAPHML